MPALIKGKNDIYTVNEKLASEWNYERNGEITPSDIAIGSQKKVWWKCEKGHEWQATPRIEIMGQVARIVQEDYL